MCTLLGDINYLFDVYYMLRRRMTSTINQVLHSFDVVCAHLATYIRLRLALSSKACIHNLWVCSTAEWHWHRRMIGTINKELFPLIKQRRPMIGNINQDQQTSHVTCEHQTTSSRSNKGRWASGNKWWPTATNINQCMHVSVVAGAHWHEHLGVG